MYKRNTSIRLHPSVSHTDSSFLLFCILFFLYIFFSSCSFWFVSVSLTQGDKPYECRYCGQRFADRTNLKRHELQHVKQQKKAELQAKEREKEAAKEDKKKKKGNGSADETFLQISNAAAAAAAISFGNAPLVKPEAS